MSIFYLQTIQHYRQHSQQKFTLMFYCFFLENWIHFLTIFNHSTLKRCLLYKMLPWDFKICPPFTLSLYNQAKRFIGFFSSKVRLSRNDPPQDTGNDIDVKINYETEHSYGPLSIASLHNTTWTFLNWLLEGGCIQLKSRATVVIDGIFDYILAH